jgi:galactan 5-O-arabinofuranosyltransferase
MADAKPFLQDHQMTTSSPPRQHPWSALLTAIRPFAFAGAVAAVVLAIHQLSIWQGVHPRSGRTEYGLHTAAIITAAIAAAAVWGARRRGKTWDADLLPALFGGLAALTLLTALHATPFDQFGIRGDQSFRTAAVTRFAATWFGQDYTYQGLPSYYAPGYFWILGRAAALTGVAPWHMLKFGTIAVAFLAPMISYLLWRRLVEPRTAAMISAIPLLIPSLYESYGWIVQVAIIPWWLEAVHGLTRNGLRKRNPLILGLIGSALFCTYYYYYFVFVLVFALYQVVAWRRGIFDWKQTKLGLGILGIAALGSSPYWGPLGWNFLTAEHFEPLNNRWITLNSGDLTLPMLEPSVLGALCLVGLVFLVVHLNEALPRALLIVLASLYIWHAVGFFFAAMDKPLMSFRMKELVPLVLLTAAAMALVRWTKLAMSQRPWVSSQLTMARSWQVVAVGATVLAVFAGDRFVTKVVDDSRVKAAHDQALPNGKLPAFHSTEAKALQPSSESIRALIERHFTAGRLPIVLSDRTDLFAFYPYYGFVQWNANYSHPTSRYHSRLDFLDKVAEAGSASEFARRTADNPFDKIDVVVLHIEKDNAVFRSADDDFPFGTKGRTIKIPTNLFDSDHFHVTNLNGYLIAVRR